MRLDERDERGERRRARLVLLARRRLVDRDRLARRARRRACWSVVGMRFGSERSVIEAIPIGTSRRAIAAAGSRVASRATSRVGLPGPAARAHRERRVEEDERLRVGALAHELLANDDRLRGGNGDERGEERRARRRPGRRRAGPARCSGEHAADRARRGARSAGARRAAAAAASTKSAVERRQERHAERARASVAAALLAGAAPAAEAVAAARVVAELALARPLQPQHELEVLLRVERCPRRSRSPAGSTARRG